MSDELRLIYYPDPRLKRVSAAVERFDDPLRELAERMLTLMREHRGIGLAAPQVGKNLRMFVMNPTSEPEGHSIYINPVLVNTEGEETSEEGCLSLPGINIEVIRSKTATLRAQDLEGRPIEITDTGYIPRVWQHEVDHLNGILLTDRMGATARMMSRKTLRELEEKYYAAHPSTPQSKKARAAR